MEIYSILILKGLPYIPWVKISPLKIITFYSVFCDVNCSCNPKIHLLHYFKYCIFHWLVFVNHHSLFSSNSLKYLDISFIYRSVYGIYYKNNTCRLLLFTYEWFKNTSKTKSLFLLVLLLRKKLEAVCWNWHNVGIMKSTETVKAVIEPSRTTFFMKYHSTFI